MEFGLPLTKFAVVDVIDNSIPNLYGMLKNSGCSLFGRIPFSVGTTLISSEITE